MKSASLIACPGCARHVRVGENACPFCKASLGEATRAFTARLPPKERLSRSALYAFGVGSLTVATACGGSVANRPAPDTDASQADAADTAADDSGFEDAGTDDSGSDDAGVFDGATVALYGGFVFDAGAPDADEGDAASDATDFPDVGIAPPYGGPPKG